MLGLLTQEGDWSFRGIGGSQVPLTIEGTDCYKQNSTEWTKLALYTCVVCLFYMRKYS